MYYIFESNKTFATLATDLEAEVKKNNFGLLYTHDLGEKMRSKGIDFKGEIRVFEVCKPPIAASLLKIDLALNMALPCRISIYTEADKLKIGFLKPIVTLSAIGTPTAEEKLSIEKHATEVENILLTIVNAAK